MKKLFWQERLKAQIACGEFFPTRESIIRDSRDQILRLLSLPPPVVISIKEKS